MLKVKWACWYDSSQPLMLKLDLDLRNHDESCGAVFSKAEVLLKSRAHLSRELEAVMWQLVRIAEMPSDEVERWNEV